METVQPVPNTGEVKISPPNQLIQEDINGAKKKALVFIAPLVLLYTAYVTTNLSDGFVWSDLVPNMVLAGSMVYWLMTTLTDLFTRYVGSTKYRV